MRTKIILIVLFMIANLYSQVREIKSISFLSQGDFEVNFSTNLGVAFSSYGSTNTSKSFNYYDSTYSTYTYSSDHSSRDFLFLFCASIGYYFIDGLSFEPELEINLISYDEISVTTLANLTYNIKTSSNKVIPYIKLGYGLSNYITNYNYYGGPSDNSLDTKVFNAAAGIKLVHNPGLVMRLELNYKSYSNANSYSYSNSYSQTSIETESGIDALSIAFGYSILF